ncbi:MAG: ATP-binding cassette domain-containing protein [Pseudomonadota bacterium]|nr:ATP-binding cassette domain-containing protein [Pseudomonadota bacterium]
MKPENQSFIYSLIKDYWFDYKDNPELNKYQKKRWYYLLGIILLECSLATIVFFSAVFFASFIGAIEVGSVALFFYYLPILAGLLFGALIIDTAIKNLTGGLTKEWRYYIYASETETLCDAENLKKFDQRDKAIECNSPSALIRTLAVCVSDLLEAGTTIITALIQFVPCVVILLVINPYLPIVTFFVCFVLLLTCFTIAKIMNESQTKYMTFENQHFSSSEEVAANANTYSMMPDLLKSRKNSLNETTNSAGEEREEYRTNKTIFDFFVSLAEKVVLYGPYLFFGFYAIQSGMSMSEFTLMVNTFIQASANLMKINQIQTLLVKAKAAGEQYKQYQHILSSDIKPVIKPATSTDKSVKFNAKILKLETTKPYKIRIQDQNGENVIQKFNPDKVAWENKKPDFLNNQYCLTNFKGDLYTNDPIKFNKSDIPKLEKNKDIIFAKRYEYNYKLDFDIPFGKKILIKGESGTGKSLIIKAISDNYRLGYGQISLPDISRTLHVTQHAIVDLAKTWRDELVAALPTEEANKVKYDDKKMMTLLGKYFGSQTGVIDLDRTIGHLSGGQKQRFVLCRLLLKEPKSVDLITLDEPFSAVGADMELSYLSDIYEHFSASTIMTISHSKIKKESASNAKSLIGLHDGMLEVKVAGKGLFDTVGNTSSSVTYHESIQACCC